MVKDNQNEALDLVYSARTPEEVAAGYAAWAASYDRETAALGYCLPFMITSWVARHVAAGEGPLLDAGCGTGLSGMMLAALGYGDIEGLDIAAGMLDIARSRNVYGDLKEAALGDSLPWTDGHFRAFFSTGVFTIGHAPASGLVDLVRITRRSGHGIFTVRDQVFESGGFKAVFADLEDQGKWRLVEESPWFPPYVVSEPEARVKTFVFQIL